ncbi:ubiquinone biosynthesis monooxygenase COQ6, mitochondrial-like isoform X3 [Zingiber officinale]|nr:ubiquinone biosynthesis monooxygenase COQ6, mitochondrial-like isoform X3 [Zingiber officinale]XP_042422855.1 ubiquinone biosynthesis monooxygenase COQ6, mitochondrial-like isoform X3 [Zingiber officinale]XP_042422856.1 ubiquinone biosynthesis monooxygenase COQ6, mitochondrial-like isoform X3 [Zingiber officinale]
MWNLSRISFNNVQKSTRHSYAIPLTIFSLQNDSCFMRGFYTLNSQESGGLILPELLRNKSLLSPDCATAAKVMGHDSRVHFKVCEKNYSVTANSEPFDVAIIGGGMVGLALASALSSTPFTKHLNVAIVDPNPALGGSSYYIKNEIPGSRVSTVTPATISFLRDIGAWEHVKHQRHAFFDQMQVWDYTGLGYTRYCSRDVGKEYLGCVVENKVLCNSLLLSLQQEKDFKKTIIPAKLTSMTVSSRSSSSGVSSGQSNTLDKSRTNNSEETAEPMHLQSLVRLELSDGQHIYSKLVVGADGAKSRVREMAGIKTTGWDYSQSGLICTVEHTGENHCAWQRFLPSGPIALLPIGDNFSNIVWTMSSNEANRHKLMSEDDFVKAVNYALDCGYGPHPQSNFLDNYIGRLPWGSGTTSIKESFQAPPKVIDVVSERMAFPLSLMHALEYSSSQFVLIGDAAHAVHPLAGQGVNLGFGDASTLTKVISEGISMGTDFADLALLKRYEKERKAANIPWMAILDGFQKAYSIDFGPINLLRAAALHGAQYIAPLKRNIVSYAMGEWNWPRFT